MRVIWTPEAQRDRADVWDFIVADNPHAAVLMDERFSNAATSLAENPELGRPGKVAGTRELVLHESYCLVYEVENEVVWVLALVHTARQWPPLWD